jgi:hypothetical protein
MLKNRIKSVRKTFVDFFGKIETKQIFACFNLVVLKSVL